MPYFLIMIKKRNWDIVSFPWLQKGELHADPIGDLKTRNNSLSVWHIESDESNLEKVALGLIINRSRIDKFEYGLFDQNIIEKLGIRIEVALGNLPMPEVNGWHRDLIQLTANSLVKLANELYHGIQKRLLLDDEAKELIINASRNGLLRLEAVNNSDMRREIMSLLG